MADKPYRVEPCLACGQPIRVDDDCRHLRSVGLDASYGGVSASTLAMRGEVTPDLSTLGERLLGGLTSREAKLLTPTQELLLDLAKRRNHVPSG